MARITSVRAREILDSRGNPTVEVEIELDSGSIGRAAVPSGASTGSREAVELRDGGERYRGMGVRRAVGHVRNEIAAAIATQSLGGLEEQAALDRLLLDLDGTKTKSKLGANAILGVSLAAAHAAASDRGQPLYAWLAPQAPGPLPLPMMNILNGGVHAANRIDFQEYMILPTGASSFSEALRLGCEVFHTLREILLESGHVTSVGDEGGFAPDLESNQAAIEVVLRAIERAGFRPGEEICLALDVAASELFEDGRYRLRGEGRDCSADELIRLYEDWAARYPLVSIEDGLAEEDWDGWVALTATLGSCMQIVGDDIYVTNPEILRQGIERRASNAILIKVNQIGTLTETLETIELAESAGFARVISHRSGETEDTTIADLAVGSAAGQIKTGSLCRSDRVAKYNQLLRIEEALGPRARFAGREMLAPLG